MKKSISIFLIILFGGLLLLFIKNSESSKFTWNLDFIKTTLPLNIKNISQLNSDFDKSINLNSADSESNNTADSNEVSKEFKSWIETHTKMLESNNLDSEVIQKELNLKSSQLSLLEKNYLLKNLLLQNSHANFKIFSTFLLSLSPLHNSNTLIDFINSASIIDAPPIHSPEEVLSMQEKTLKNMAISSLIEFAKKNPEQKEKIIAIINNINNSELREKALKQLN